jgi:hypothetical protein
MAIKLPTAVPEFEVRVSSKLMLVIWKIDRMEGHMIQLVGNLTGKSVCSF